MRLNYTMRRMNCTLNKLLVYSILSLFFCFRFILSVHGTKHLRVCCCLYVDASQHINCAFLHVVQPCVDVKFPLYCATAHYAASYPPKIVDPDANATKEVELGKCIQMAILCILTNSELI